MSRFRVFLIASVGLGAFFGLCGLVMLAVTAIQASFGDLAAGGSVLVFFVIGGAGLIAGSWDPLHSDRTAVSDATAKPSKTGSTR